MHAALHAGNSYALACCCREPSWAWHLLSKEAAGRGCKGPDSFHSNSSLPLGQGWSHELLGEVAQHLRLHLFGGIRRAHCLPNLSVRSSFRRPGAHRPCAKVDGHQQRQCATSGTRQVLLIFRSIRVPKMSRWTGLMYRDRACLSEACAQGVSGCSADVPIAVH